MFPRAHINAYDLSRATRPALVMSRNVRRLPVARDVSTENAHNNDNRNHVTKD